MSRPYEFADESLYGDDKLVEIVEGCNAAAIQTDDTETLTDLEHMARHSQWEWKQRHYGQIAARIVIEEYHEN